MSIVVIFIIGCLVGYMICMGQWVQEIFRQVNENEMEISKLKAEIEPRENEE